MGLDRVSPSWPFSLYTSPALGMTSAMCGLSPSMAPAEGMNNVSNSSGERNTALVDVFVSFAGTCDDGDAHALVGLSQGDGWRVQGGE